MNRRLIFLGLLTLFISLLVACGSVSNDTSSSQPADIDVSSLSVDLEVSDVNALRENPNVVLIDVREQYEYDEGHIPCITLIPLGTIPNRLDEIPTDKEVILVCRSGNRSNQATQFLQQQGFDNVHNMLGGMNAWGEAGYSIDR